LSLPRRRGFLIYILVCDFYYISFQQINSDDIIAGVESIHNKLRELNQKARKGDVSCCFLQFKIISQHYYFLKSYRNKLG